jgi:hypothetical protein
MQAVRKKTKSAAFARASRHQSDLGITFDEVIVDEPYYDVISLCSGPIVPIQGKLGSLKHANISRFLLPLM